jgi:ABC-type uncharacterized transport system substrate-binding protein
MANVLGQHYFSEFWHNGQRVKFDNRPTEYGMTRRASGGADVCAAAGAAAAAGRANVTFSTFDPTYYVDMRYDKDSDVRLPAALQKLQGKVMTPKPSEETLNFAQSLDKADAPPEDMELGKQFAQEVTLQCQ